MAEMIKIIIKDHLGKKNYTKKTNKGEETQMTGL